MQTPVQNGRYRTAYMRYDHVKPRNNAHWNGEVGSSKNRMCRHCNDAIVGSLGRKEASKYE